jgi:hypothetical protein
VLPKRLDPAPIARKWAAAVPQYIARSARSLAGLVR